MSPHRSFRSIPLVPLLGLLVLLPLGSAIADGGGSASLALTDLVPAAGALGEDFELTRHRVQHLSDAAQIGKVAEKAAGKDHAFMFAGLIEMLRSSFEEHSGLHLFGHRYESPEHAVKVYEALVARGAFFEDKTGTDRCRFYSVGSLVVVLYVEPNTSEAAEERLAGFLLETLVASGEEVSQQRFEVPDAQK